MGLPSCPIKTLPYEVRGKGTLATDAQRGRLSPAFQPSSWNVHKATVTGDPRIKNVCKGWKNKYRHLSGHQHPSIWKSIQCLQKEHEAVEVVVVQAETG